MTDNLYMLFAEHQSFAVRRIHAVPTLADFTPLTLALTMIETSDLILLWTRSRRSLPSNGTQSLCSPATSW
jgi:hypothetical protein